MPIRVCLAIMLNILGVNAYHADAAACIIKDGRLIFAVEEERLNRIKHWAGFPSLSIKACLEFSNLTLADIDFIAFNSNPYENLPRKVAYTLRHQPSFRFIKSRFRNTRTRLNAESDFERHFPGQQVRSKFKKIEHHRAHLASAYYACDFSQACVLSVDGFGDFSSSAWGLAQDDQISVDGHVYYPHSLGIFYQSITQYLGFRHYGDEYKVMGMAAYGNPVYTEPLQRMCLYHRNGKYELDLSYFLHHTNRSTYGFESGVPVCSDFYSEKLISELGPARKACDPIKQFHKDIACSAQIIFERAFFNLCHRLYEKHPTENLALSGGCAMNSLANGKISTHTPFKNVYIQAAAGDAGGAVGAAFSVAVEHGASREKLHMPHAYQGPSYNDSHYVEAIERCHQQLMELNCHRLTQDDPDHLCATVARAISKGQVIGWFQGRAEWGPRALGNRSILADPRRADIQELLNLKIKRRESFRPFAPSILIEHVDEWFEQDGEVPFMGQVFMIRKEKRPLIPAVTHVDGSGRLQTVSRSTNRLYYNLIGAFYEITGVPVLLNTSFNENEPIVCRPEEAMACFLRTNMDLLVLGRHLVSRKQINPVDE